ncbi:flagellar biosynthesis protein FlhA [Euzebya sp.]|uniref:flagellar biosynthesis protein FlhA n=1 Tax=Euzebya sp. TaxID=1971409 RepID=UPI003510D32D
MPTLRNRSIAPIAVPAAVILIVVMMVVPVPTALLDLLLAMNIAAALLVILASMQVNRPLDFAVFPSLLLVLTLFRLALNISTTRLIMLDGYAGKVIEAFGNFVIGGSLVVGLIVFLILVVVQFMVITNGAGRVAEVGARFTLDAMPGKQMAIDADLNAGLIDEAQARKRREEVAAEADFYGAMDGASKFVKGDAMASIIITAINLIGGLVIGVVQQGMDVGEAVSTFSLLTVGDGLVSQLPALLISIASGIIVTRAATAGDMGTDVVLQFSRQRGAIRLGGVAVALMALLPGLPFVPFVAVGAALWLTSSKLPDPEEAKRRAAEAEREREDEAMRAALPDPNSPEAILEDVQVESLQLEIAYDLMDLVDPARGGDLLDRVKALRRKVAGDLGIIIPLVRTRDNIELPPSTYSIRVHGVELGRGTAPVGHVLVIGDDTPALGEGGGDVPARTGIAALPGTQTVEPVFGLPARWVPQEYRQQAEVMGATVVDRSSVITTHLAEVVRTNAARLLSRTDTKLLAELVKAQAPTVGEELTASQLTLGDVQSVLAELLAEQVPITDLVRIFEVLTERGQHTRDVEPLVESVRAMLGPAISSALAVDGRLAVLVLDPMTEHAVVEAVRPGATGSFLALDPQLSERLAVEVARLAEQAEQQGESPVIVCSPQARPALRRLVSQVIPRLPVLGYAEIGPQLTVETVGVVNVGNPAAV